MTEIITMEMDVQQVVQWRHIMIQEMNLDSSAHQETMLLLTFVMSGVEMVEDQMIQIHLIPDEISLSLWNGPVMMGIPNLEMDVMTTVEWRKDSSVLEAQL